jgi:hypothetical protein
MEVRFQILVEPSREAVTAKEGSGSNTARTFPLAHVSPEGQYMFAGESYIAFVAA